MAQHAAEHLIWWLLYTKLGSLFMPKAKIHFTRCSLLLLATVLFVSSATVRAQEAREQPWTLTAYFENDLFAQTDQSYTNGVRLSWVSPDISSYVNDSRLPGWIRDVNDTLHFFHDINTRDCGESEANPNACLQRNLVISLGQIMFTPEDPNAADLIEADRPYAGYLYTTFGYHTRNDRQLDTIEFSLGIVGPSSLAQESQDFVHDLRGLPNFQGWDNQLRDEPVAQMLYEHKNRIDLGQLGSDWIDEELRPEHEFITHWGGNFGNALTYANVGFEYRIGLGLPDDFGTAALRPGGDNSAPGRFDSRSTEREEAAQRSTPFSLNTLKARSVHLFAAADGRAVAHDIFLDGNNFKGSHSVNKKYLVGDISLGVGFIYHRWKVSFSHVWRSREFEGQERPHEFGSVSVSYSY